MLQKTHDKLGRLLRHAEPQPRYGKAIYLQESDYLVGEWLNVHGLLPTPYLYDAQKHLRSDYTGFQKRLRDLWRETKTPHGGAYLSRVKRQTQTREADKQPVTHELTDHFRLALAARGVQIRSFMDHVHHRFMNATITASMRLTAPEYGLRYLTCYDILAHPKFPEATRRLSDPFALPISDRRRIVPDDFFAFAYPDSTYRFCVLEDDRGTESASRADVKITTYGRKLERYVDALLEDAHVSHWGLPNLYILIVTTNPGRMHNMISYVERITARRPSLRRYFLFKYKPLFADEWIVPPIMHDLLTDPWERPGVDPFCLLR